jgi:two-component system response regulator MprA
MRSRRIAVKLRILVVEDDEAVRTSLSNFLRAWGHDVDTADDGAAGLKAALASRYDVAILDLSMPRMDGLDVCRKLVESAERPYLIAHTAWVRPDDQKRVRDAGFNVHFRKGRDPQELLRILADVIPRS